MINNLIEMASEITFHGGPLSSSERYTSKVDQVVYHDDCDCHGGDCSDCYCTDCNEGS